MTNKIFPCVIGLGYVGLPVFVRLNKKYKTVGFDTSLSRTSFLKKKKDLNNEINPKDLHLFNGSKITSNPENIKECNIYIITVPTPLKNKHIPDLKCLEQAYQSISKFLKKNDIVVVESTVYPGASKELAKKVFEKKTKLKSGKDFYLAYSPERINPGDKNHQIQNTEKILAIETNNVYVKNKILKIYKSITSKLKISNSIEEAETAKVIENIQRDLNIALMNDIFIFCKRMNLNFKNILELAGTKWNFLKFSAGLVGGHCLPVDPYYLSYIAKKNNISLETVLAGRSVNHKLKNFIFKQIRNKILNFNRKNKKKCRVLISGITYKKNVADIRNSYALEIYLNLKKNFKNIYALDKYCDKLNRKKFNILDKIKLNYDLLIFLVDHNYNKKLYKSAHLKKIELFDPFGYYQ